MGRELTDSNMDKNYNALENLDGPSKDRSHIPSKISDDSSEAKDYEIKEYTKENSAHKPDVLRAKSTNVEGALNEVKEEKLGSQKSSPSSMKSPAARNGRSKYTVPETFPLATGKHLSGINCKAASEFESDVNSPVNANIKRSPVASKNSQPSSPETSTGKSLSDKKHSADEDDNWSLASPTAASARTNKNVTVASAPKFRCYERIEKRKEFYRKLEQKHQALEEEKLQSEQRMKEEQEAAIKELRKNMVVKANPVPSFYYEPPPPKPQLKKLPLTRPKSPKFSRRRSCGDAINSSQEEKKKSNQGNRHSLGSYKTESSPSPTSRVKNKSQFGGQRLKPEKEDNEVSSLTDD